VRVWEGKYAGDGYRFDREPETWGERTGRTKEGIWDSGQATEPTRRQWNLVEGKSIKAEGRNCLWGQLLKGTT